MKAVFLIVCLFFSVAVQAESQTEQIARLEKEVAYLNSQMDKISTMIGGMIKMHENADAKIEANRKLSDAGIKRNYDYIRLLHPKAFKK